MSLLQNITDGKYKNFEEFKADAQLIVHNTAILFGGEERQFMSKCSLCLLGCT